MQLWSHNLWSACWKASSIIQTQSKDQRTGHPWCRSQSESKVPRTRSGDICGQKKMHVPFQAESNSFLCCCCCAVILLGLSMCWTMLERTSSLLSPQVQMLVSSRNTFLDSPKNEFPHSLGIMQPSQVDTSLTIPNRSPLFW